MPAIKITSENFESEVVNSGKTFLLDFWAPWCGPCRMVSPLVDEVADELNDGTKAVGKINVDEEGSLAERFGILSIPTLIVVRGNEVITKAVGGREKEEIAALLARALCAADKMLLLDEPVSGLDPKVSARMYDLIDSLNKDDGVTVIMISHDISAAVQYARHILHLGSRDVFFGSVEEYRKSPLGMSFISGAGK